MVTIAFTLAHRQFGLSADDIRDRLVQHRPEPIYQYWVEIDAVRWPVKQVMALATGLSKAEFQSQNCRRLLGKLGFSIGQGNAVLPSPPVVARARRTASAPTSASDISLVDVVLVGCVKTKRRQGAPARDLYTSDYFSKMRAYAESAGRPWFILSAEHGLVRPGEWLEPYDCYLPATSREYRRAWGRKVAAQLEQAIGPLAGVVVDIHAGAAYVVAAETALRPRGVTVVDQLTGLTFGRRLSWYRQHTKGSGAGAQEITAHLRDGSRSVTLDHILASNGAGLRAPGLYSWWVDVAGAHDLTMGLGYDVAPGLIYAGLAGATRSGGSTSANTLWGRIATMHLGNRHEFSTLRRSLGSVLASARGLLAIDESQLTQWMHAHLRVITVPVADADTLGSLESEILVELDPPLNLAKVAKTPIRARLSALRKQFGSKATVVVKERQSG